MNSGHPMLLHRELLQRKGRKAPWVALFDIDSTLMDTAPRNAAILEAAYGSVPGLESWRGRLSVDARDWGILEPLKRAGIEDQGLFTRLLNFWTERFFSNDWLVHDRPYPGVPGFLSRLKAEGFLLAYLTGRDIAGMEAGTRKSFLAHGLPAGPQEVFFFKPTFEMDDKEFKGSALDSVAELGTLVAAVDNEPANVNLFRSTFSDAQVIWIDTLTSPEPEILKKGIDKTGLDFFLSHLP